MSKFWKVSIYNTYREYGGPEEGGWYYTAGHAVKCLPRKFSSRQAALAYCKKISHRVDSATVKEFNIPNVRNSYSMFKTYIWFKGSGPKELPVPYYCQEVKNERS